MVRVKVANDYSDIEPCAGRPARTLIPVRGPRRGGSGPLEVPYRRGGKWFALHATNSVLEWLSHDPPLLRAPRITPTLWRCWVVNFYLIPL
ncbi:MAG: hypothetical protein CM15mP74_27140 [Halieaceae bacterium]|nr:MAG: hypothetical protein CM15mP74_27140 [Halieaceae bacterium]